MTTAVCVHHWLLGDAGAVVPAFCTNCGERREFKGGYDYFDVDEDGYGRGYASKGGVAKKAANARRPKAAHGTRARYLRGCHCDECRAAAATYARAHRKGPMVEAVPA